MASFHGPTKNLEDKVNFLVRNIPSLIKNFDYRKGPDLYFYRKVINKRRGSPLEKLFSEDYFIELLYATLVAWDMNARGAKMKYFDEFKESVLKNRKAFEELESLKITQIKEEGFPEVKEKIKELYDDLHVMQTSKRLVSNSKIMHFILPDLIMPMDGKHTLVFFSGNTNETTGKFLDIIECSWKVARGIDLNKFLDGEWNLSAPKVIDNAIISVSNPRYRKGGEV